MEEGRSEKNGLILSKPNFVGENRTVVQQTTPESTLFALFTGLTFRTWLAKVRNYIWKGNILYGFRLTRNTLR